jgi:hypothetical protein
VALFVVRFWALFSLITYDMSYVSLQLCRSALEVHMMQYLLLRKQTLSWTGLQGRLCIDCIGSSVGHGAFGGCSRMVVRWVTVCLGCCKRDPGYAGSLALGVWADQLYCWHELLLDCSMGWHGMPSAASSS